MDWCKKLASKLVVLKTLSIQESAILAEAWFTLLWVDLVISFRPYTSWRHWLECSTAQQQVPASSRRADTVNPIRIARLCDIAARNHLRTMNCLRRTLALQKLLIRRQFNVQLHIGVRKQTAVIEAHAWLSQEGRILNDTDDVAERYSELQPGQWAGIRSWV